MADEQDGKDKKDEKPDLGKAFGHLKSAASGFSDVVKHGSAIFENAMNAQKARDNYGIDNSRLAMTREEFDKLINPVLDKAGDSGKKYKNAFYAYRASADALMAKAQRYKALIGEEVKLLAENQAAGQSRARIQAQLAQNADPVSGPYRNYLACIYTDMKAKVLDLLYEEYLATKYTTLSDRAFPGTSDQSIAQLRMTHAVIDGWMNKRRRELGTPTQSIAITMELRKEHYGHLFETLVECGRVLINIDPKDTEIGGHFAGKKNVRVKRCTVQVPGAKLARQDRPVMVAITNSGIAKFRTRKDQMMVFYHDPMNALCEQNYTENGEPKGEPQGGEFGTGGYILVSPFGVWSVKFPNQDSSGTPMNEGLDLSNVNVLRLKMDCSLEADVFRL